MQEKEKSRKRVNKQHGDSHLFGQAGTPPSRHGGKERITHHYLQPAWLSRWAYILPMSPMPMMPMEAFSLERVILQGYSREGETLFLIVCFVQKEKKKEKLEILSSFPRPDSSSGRSWHSLPAIEQRANQIPRINFRAHRQFSANLISQRCHFEIVFFLSSLHIPSTRQLQSIPRLKNGS